MISWLLLAPKCLSLLSHCWCEFKCCLGKAEDKTICTPFSFKKSLSGIALCTIWKTFTSSQFILSDANFSSFDYMAVVASAYGSRFVVSILWLVTDCGDVCVVAEMMWYSVTL